MIHTGEVYINPLTDFGFKRIFGTKFNSDLLVSFLNAIFDGERVIKSVEYSNNEHFGTNEISRRAVFDVYCTTDTGARIIVEMQNVYQNFYKDRSIYYSTFAITDQAKKGDWDYQLNEVYTVGILNFAFPEDKANDDDDCVFKEVKLMNVKTKKVFYDKLTYLYVELARFNKPLEECETIKDKWLFCLTNMSNLLERPAALQGRVFEKLFQQAEIAKFTPTEAMEYEQSVNAYRDIKNGMEAKYEEGFGKGLKQGHEEGHKEGLKEGIAKGEKKGVLQVAKTMKEKGMSLYDISDMTNLTIEEIKEL